MSQVSYGTITITDTPSSGSINQHFWFNPTQQGTLLAGAYITDTVINTFKSGKSGGYLLARSDGLILGKASNRYMELEGSELKFYKSGTTDSTATITTNIAAKLNSTGLEIANGGVKAGTPGQNGFVYLSSEDYPKGTSGITINSHTPDTNDPAWREIIGTKFGVDSEGNLYASNADISGKIIATEGEIGGCTIDSNGHLIVPSAYIAGTLTVTTIEGGTFNTNDYIRLSSEDSQSISIGNSGSKTDWRIIAGNTFGVDKAGNLYATSAHINGEIEATTGLIGGNDGWHIGTNAIYSGNHSAYDTANVNGIFLGKGTSNYYISGGPGAKWWIKDDGTFQLGISGISYDGSTVTFGSNVTMPTLTVDTITGGTAGTNGFIYLSKNDYGDSISIGGSASKTDWKLIAGSKFGVDDEGNLYANNVNITGDVYSTGGSTGGFTIDSTSIHTTGVDVTSNASNSVALSSSTFTRTVNSISRSNLKFAIGSKFAVANDGTLYANGAYITNIDASQITTGTLSASRIDTSSITLSKIQSDSTHYAQISSSGLIIYNGSTSYPVASFGSTIRMGPSNSDHIQISNNQLQICDGSGPYGYIEGTYGTVLTIGTYSLNNNLWLQTKRTSLGMYGSGEWEFIGRSASYDFDFQNSRLKNVPSYSSTDSSAANVYIGSGGRFNRSTHGSSERFKNSISPIIKESLLPKHLLDIEIVQYKYNDTELTKQNDFRRGEFLPGYIAEQVQKVYPIAVDLDSEGRANNINLHYLIPGMLALIQELNQRISKLEGKS